jgi:hypothetical protein
MILSTILIIISAIANAVMDKISFHHSTSIFKNWSNFWNPKESWKNKWKNGDKQQGERFPLSSSLLVGFTDAWHAAKFVMRWSMLGAVISYGASEPMFGLFYDGVLMGFMMVFTFGLFFTYLLTKKK